MSIFISLVLFFMLLVIGIVFYYKFTNTGRKANIKGKLKKAQTISEMADTCLEIQRTQEEISGKVVVIKNRY